jgi:cytochrome c oxidase subunit I
MFIMGISNYAALVFSLLTMLVAVPSAIKIFNWAFTLHKGSITFETPMLYAFGFMGLFTIGGLTGVFLGSLGTDIHSPRRTSSSPTSTSSWWAAC